MPRSSPVTRTRDLDTPALVIDLDILERNLDHMAEATRRAGVKLRPHTKTHKSPLIARMQLDRGAAGIAVAKLGEAEVMAGAGITDILIAYPILGDAKLRRLADLCRRPGADIKVAVDSVEVGRGIARVGREVGRPVPVYLEVDTGLHRMGLEPGEPIVDLARSMRALDGLDIIGVMGHAGHVARAATLDEIARIAHEDAKALVRTADLLRRAGFTIREVAPGSTPAARYSLEVPGITELRPGTYVFNDVNTVARWAATWDDCAAVVLATVVSRPAPDRAVIDAGSKVFAHDPSLHPDVPGHGYVMVCSGSGASGAPGHPGRPGLVLERLSEEHGVIRIQDPAIPLRVGDRLAVVPNHICTTVNHFDLAYGVRHPAGGQGGRLNGEIELEIPIAARGKFC